MAILFTIIGDTFFRAEEERLRRQVEELGPEGLKVKNCIYIQERCQKGSQIIEGEENLYLLYLPSSSHSFIFTTTRDNVTGFLRRQVFTSYLHLCLSANVNFFQNFHRYYQLKCTTGINETGGKQGKWLNIILSYLLFE